MADDDLSDFTRDTFTHDGKTKTVYRLGTGPAVIVMAEIPGITPKVAEFARKVAGIGCTAVVPSLFGADGHDIQSNDRGIRGTLSDAAAVLPQMCVSREFTRFAVGKSSPVVDWLRALAKAEHERCGGPGVGAIGMCFTGGFALAMAVDDRVLAPVLSQPSMPLGITPSRRRNIDISPADLSVVKDRCAAGGLQVLGMRFKSDRLVPGARFEFLREQLGDAFVAIELEDEDANPDALIPPHSVVTEHLIDEPGQPTHDALQQVLDMFATKLGVSAAK
ncbi:dienelactone hydrolase family protein [Jongsikchunia kroppenstedtii]|uniref:dienelactone hydrolase family protein n=1 Tax=Jongsikchunia kroppenstedtii TaxID=1121721 RepID=UPI0003672641|nr:dienelactone hydrolase family protein [Jongsikchunia kroppenstedtii]